MEIIVSLLLLGFIVVCVREFMVRRNLTPDQVADRRRRARTELVSLRVQYASRPRKRVRHLLHLGLTVVTLGLWVIPWIWLTIWARIAPPEDLQMQRL